MFILRLLFLLPVTIILPSAIDFLNVSNSVDTWWNLLGALNGVLDFYENCHEDMNFDGIFGLHVLESMVSTMLLKEEHKTLSLSFGDSLQKFQFRAKNISSRVLPQFVNKTKYDSYVINYLILLERPWSFWKYSGLSEISAEMLLLADDSEGIDQQSSDECMQEILSHARTESRTILHHQSCILSDKCLTRMTQSNATDYGLTHQLLYLFLLHMYDCENALEDWFDGRQLTSMYDGRVVIALRSHFGRKMTKEASDNKAIIKNGGVRRFPHFRERNVGSLRRLKDLWLEQVFIGLSLGINEFLSDENLKMIIGMQNFNGCFGGESLTWNVSKSSRRLLAEKEMKGGCYSHMTAVGASALVSFLRRFTNEHVSNSLLNGNTKEKLYNVRKATDAFKFSNIFLYILIILFLASVVNLQRRIIFLLMTCRRWFSQFSNQV